jgi:hypothetical protein
MKKGANLILTDPSTGTKISTILPNISTKEITTYVDKCLKGETVYVWTGNYDSIGESLFIPMDVLKRSYIKIEPWGEDD